MGSKRLLLLLTVGLLLRGKGRLLREGGLLLREDTIWLLLLAIATPKLFLRRLRVSLWRRERLVISSMLLLLLLVGRLELLSIAVAVRLLEWLRATRAILRRHL
jgi:hypothetical protein